MPAQPRRALYYEDDGFEVNQEVPGDGADFYPVDEPRERDADDDGEEEAPQRLRPTMIALRPGYGGPVASPQFAQPKAANRVTATPSVPTDADEPERRRRKRGTVPEDEKKRRPHPGTRHVYLRHVPETTIAKIALIADAQGESVSGYIIRLLNRYAEKH